MSDQPRTSTISVAIVSKGRPHILAETLESLYRQTLKPAKIVVVVPAAEDLPPEISGDDRVLAIVGPLGASVQRNKAIAAIPTTVDYVAFFDDDVELKPDYLQGAVTFLDACSSVAGFSGYLLANGGIEREEARRLVSDHVPTPHFRSMFFSSGKDHILHGCNMVVRRGLLEYEIFDEDLPFYSYAEDYDLSIRLESYGRIGKFEGCIAVHLATPGGRVREEQRGYSLVANNVHFIRKGTVHLPVPQAWLRLWIICVAKPLGLSLWNLLKRDRSHDWAGRARGILLAVRDLASGQCRPDRIRDL
jgi:GT2 family glycosyltransferase